MKGFPIFLGGCKFEFFRGLIFLVGEGIETMDAPFPEKSVTNYSHLLNILNLRDKNNEINTGNCKWLCASHNYKHESKSERNIYFQNILATTLSIYLPSAIE